MLVKYSMSVDPVTVSPEATIAEAIHLMLDKHISGLPVVDKSGRLVGMLSEGDLLRRAETGTQKKRARWLEWLLNPGALATEYAHSHGRRVAEHQRLGGRHHADRNRSGREQRRREHRGTILDEPHHRTEQDDEGGEDQGQAGFHASLL